MWKHIDVICFSDLFDDISSIYKDRPEEITINIKWLFDLCDRTPPLKLHLIKYLTHSNRLSPYMSATEIKRMEKMISEIDFPEFEIRVENTNLEA